MKRYIVTGGAGHLGGTLLRLLAETDGEVYALLLPEERPVTDSAGIHYVYGDVLRPETLRPLFDWTGERETIVIHTAGIISIAEKASPAMYDVNVNGTKNMLWLAAQNRVARFVHVGSVHTIPEAPDGQTMGEVNAYLPERVTGGYAQTKAAGARAVMEAGAKGLPAVIVHPSGIIGPYDRGRNHLVQLVRRYMDGKLPACVRGGYDFVDVRDVAEGCLLAAARGVPGQSYIVSGHYISIYDLLALAGRYCRKKPVPALPVWTARLAAPILEASARRRGERPLYTRYSLHTLTANGRFSNEKARRELGFSPRDIEETVRDMTNWLLENP